ncbi:hypothetical protein CR163_003695 [Prosthecochloris sp. ZM_2]|uniref:lamin tail domain-containing protein n=1 Tax=Prosthecochloris sp. ZM_2 TaxID=2045206 RepID=UPI000DF7CE84|nr:lamin tail domain-containing protein [Prosthecochloris sp. ZM_2]RNA64424.1 hypothetical protein CR163_003695 [Prosthecochloris sp. ZM_2]
MRPHHLLLCLFCAVLIGCNDYSEEDFPVSGPSLHATRPPGPVINEIMFAPRSTTSSAGAEQPEYIEIYNAGPSVIDLSGWRIEDSPSPSGRIYTFEFSEFPSPNHLLGPDEYAVITPEPDRTVTGSRLQQCYPFTTALKGLSVYVDDRKTLSLNNDHDCIRLIDDKGNLVDEVCYDEAWHNPYLRETRGYALEKFSPLLSSSTASSWSTCLDGTCSGTPGKQNSLYLPAHETSRAPNMMTATETFSPNGDGLNDTAVFLLTLPAGAYQMTFTIHDRSGSEICRPADGLPSGPTARLTWDGTTTHGSTAASGSYLARAEIQGKTGPLIFESTIVLAR